MKQTLWLRGSVLVLGVLGALSIAWGLRVEALPLGWAPWMPVVWAGIGGAVALAAVGAVRGSVHGDRWALVILVWGLLAAAYQPGLPIWSVPRSWQEVLWLSEAAVGLMAGLWLWVVLGHVLWRRCLPPVRFAVVALMAVAVGNWLFVLQRPELLHDIGRFLWEQPRWQELGGRAVVVAGANVVLAAALHVATRGHVVGLGRLWLLVVAAGIAAGISPLWADLGSSRLVAELPQPLPWVAAILCIALAQGSLWAEVFVMTGLIMDAMRGRRPTWYWGYPAFRDGLGRGAAYGILFLGLIYLADAVLHASWFRQAMAMSPLLVWALLGAILMPLAKTVLESFDGSQPFLRRLLDSASMTSLYWRGALLGIGFAYLAPADIVLLPAGERFLLGALLGILPSGFASLMWDVGEVVWRQRRCLRPWRVYAVGAALGAFVGGAMAWYLDPAQTAVIVAKFRQYVTLYAEGGGSYTIYPLFSKWGAMDLGPRDGGVRLLFDESVSGVINWSLAAPLFSVNLFVLSALFQRSWAPLRLLASREGLVLVAEGTVRVLRWGLWMAPVIYSLLRMSPDPTWYNQDGLVRTLVATVQQIRLSPEDFRGWSLDVFLALLAYDWFRILIWLDHMGLRVATLVNLSFVGGDRLDEFLARFLGARVRSRCIPEAVRRFATWAPLLIPFYLPMGRDWAYVWDGAEALARTGSGQVPLEWVVGGFVAVGVLGMVVVFRAPRGSSASCQSRCPSEDIVVQNGVYSAVFGRDGRGYARVFRSQRHGHEIDLTARPLSQAHDTGRILYVREGDAVWSLGCRPTRHPEARHEVVRLDDLSVRLTCSCRGIEARLDALVAEDGPGEAWIVLLTNVSDRPVHLEISSYRELTLNDPSAQARHPFYNRQHITTWCSAEEGKRPRCAAVLAGNRLLKAGDPARPTGETFVHLVAGLEDEAQLLGFEDSRLRFLGHGTLARPHGLFTPAQTLEDRARHVPFDPIASLRLGVDLDPGGTTAFVLVDAYGPTPEAAMALAARLAGVDPLPARPQGTSPSLPMDEADVQAMLGLEESPWFAFAADGRSLRVPWKTPRRFAHILANPLGYGVLVSNDGAIASFCGNSQQNALTPYSADATTVQEPGQMLYVRDLDSGAISSPLFVPFREEDASGAVEYGLGQCTFHKEWDGLAMDWTLFVPPDRPMEFRLLRLRNTTSRPRRLALTLYAHMILAEIPEDSRGQIETIADVSGRMLLFCRPENRYRLGWAYVAWSLDVDAHETVMSRFLGEGGDLRRPYFVVHGAADPTQEDDGLRVAAMMGTVSLAPGEETALWMVMGQDTTVADCRRRVAAISSVADVEEELRRTARWWQERLGGGVAILTSAPAVDRLVNIWLPYQVLTARLWGRLGPEQRSGAYGFRDQLQDVLPLIYSMPALARRQILLHAAQQFHAGDVLQWWHPAVDGGTGFGMRNRASDPHLWLVYVAALYAQATGDSSIWDEMVPYVEGPAVPPRAEGIAFAPLASRDRGSLFEHCLRAVQRTWRRRGPHGLPLMLAHDWNDGLSAVGVKGKGESVWLGMFFHLVARQLAPVAQARGKRRLARWLDDRAAAMARAVETAWRQDHLVRAVTDQGEVLDYADALTAAWPILSGAVPFAWAEAALRHGVASLERPRLVQLLDPPFTDTSVPYPGRIADYPPGVRENGGQYSHGSSWLVDAMVELAVRKLAGGDREGAAQARRHAMRLWLKISPLAHCQPHTMPIYGLAPHQQPADISFGPGYEGRGGWSWYTGAAARMLWGIYALLGLRIEHGQPKVDAQLVRLNPEFQVRRIVVADEVIFTSDENT